MRAILIGLPGSGKSTVARRVAEILGVPFADSDDLVEGAAGRTVREIFAQSGEQAFRDQEAAAIASALDGFEGVLALGGGAILSVGTRAAIAAAGVPVVLLQAELGTLLARLGDAQSRPLLRDDPARRLAELADRRGPVYAATATVTVATDDRTPGQVAATVAARLHELERIHG